MRDEETIKTALTAAETGHLVISTLHTVGAANTIDRIIDSFPPAQQEQVRAQLSMVMQAVVSQQLIPAVDGGVVPAFEVMFFNNAIRNLIRESKIHQIDNIIATSQEEGMITMDNSIIKLFREGKISKEKCHHLQQQWRADGEEAGKTVKEYRIRHIRGSPGCFYQPGTPLCVDLFYESSTVSSRSPISDQVFPIR